MEWGRDSMTTNLMDGERLSIQLETSSGKLFLTNLRVWHSSDSEFTSIRVEDVSSVAVVQLTHRWLLWTTGACIVLAAGLVWMGSQGVASLGMENYRRVASLLLLVSAILVMAFGTKRFTQMRIASGAETIEVRVRSMIRREMIQFVREMESAKSARSRQTSRVAERQSA